MIPEINYKDLTDEQITEIRKSLPRKKKYQRKDVYRQKENPIRFFKPDEWEKFIYSTNERWRFYFWFLFLTGARYKEAKLIKVQDIDFKDRQILIKNPKGKNIGKVMRYIQISPYAKRLIQARIRVMGLKSEDNFNFPTIQGLRNYMQKKLKEIGVKDYKDFSVHNIRKTHENYHISLGTNEKKLIRHMGHNESTANDHYISGAFIKSPKQLEKIKSWIGGSFE